MLPFFFYGVVAEVASFCAPGATSILALCADGAAQGRTFLLYLRKALGRVLKTLGKCPRRAQRTQTDNKSTPKKQTHTEKILPCYVTQCKDAMTKAGDEPKLARA